MPRLVVVLGGTDICHKDEGIDAHVSKLPVLMRIKSWTSPVDQPGLSPLRALSVALFISVHIGKDYDYW